MKSPEQPNPAHAAPEGHGPLSSLFSRLPESAKVWLKIGGVLLSLYLFIVGVSGMGDAFKLFGEDFAVKMMSVTSAPLTALSIGILATAIIQSSSTTTSMVVGLVAGGVLQLDSAIFIIMGANIGTTLTAILVSLGHVRRKQELEPAFAVAFVHAFFNLLAVCILFPLEWSTGILSRLAGICANIFQGMGGAQLSNPLAAATDPAIDAIAFLTLNNGWIMLAVTIGLTFTMLIALVKLLRSLVLHKLERFFDTHLFRNSGRAMLFGMLLTFAVQTSSVTTSLVVPLAAAGVLRLAQIYPFCLGSNVGTTITAMLAALATGSEFAIMAAFAHTLFNVLGILILWPIPAVRYFPTKVAAGMGRLAYQNRLVPLVFIAVVYFIFPSIFIFIIR